MRLSSYLSLIAYLTGLCLAAGARRNGSTIEVDIAIVGGGASGAYAAVRLRDDYHKSVLVIEKANRLGGHVHAYYPPSGRRPINYGVQAYLNRGTTEGFFERFGVGLINPGFQNYIDLVFRTKDVDFETGRDVHVHYGSAGFAGTLLALLKFAEITAKYQPWFENGYFKNEKVPDDLLLPFGDFLRKHGLESSLGILRNLLWLSDAVNTPTWTVMAVAGQPQVSAFALGLAGPSFKWPETHSSQTLFDRVLQHLRHDVLLESTVASSKRTAFGVTLDVHTPLGRRTVKAKRLLIAAPPSPNNIGPWDLSEHEKDLFSKFSWETLYVGVVNNTGIPADVPGVRNAPDRANQLFLPRGNFCDAYTRGGFDGYQTNLFTSRVIGHSDLKEEEARDLMIQPLKKMSKLAKPIFVAFAQHGLTAPKVSPAELKAGFYKKLYALQGQRCTFWTGLTWAPDYTPILWDFNEALFPKILEGL